MGRISDGDKKIAAIVVAGLTVLLTVAFSSGYFYRDHELMSNTVTRHNVTVIRQDSPYMFHVKLESGEEKDYKICDGYLLTVKSGFVFKDFTYEDLGPCKSLAPASGMGYSVVRDHGKPIKENVNYARR